MIPLRTSFFLAFALRFAGNTNEDGFLLDSSSTVNSGMWESFFDNISLSNFSGIGIHIKSRNDSFAAASQWLVFNNVVVIRNAGGGNALRLEGAVFELRFVDCHFDGAAIGDGTNIYMGGLPGGVGYPNSVHFEGLVSQFAALAVQIDGGINIIFNGSHHELVRGAYHVNYNPNVSTLGLTIADSYFAANVGVNNGQGYVLNVNRQCFGHRFRAQSYLGGAGFRGDQHQSRQRSLSGQPI